MAGSEELYDQLQVLIDNGISVKAGDIEIGAVEIKDHNSDARTDVTSSGALHTYDREGWNQINVLNGSLAGIASGTNNITTCNTSDVAVTSNTLPTDAAKDSTLNVVKGVVSTENTLHILNAGLSSIQSGTDNISSDQATETTLAKQLATTITEYNITMTTANTEYSQALPANTKAIGFHCRDAYDVRWSFVTGKVAGSTAPYFTLKAGTEASKDELNLTDKTLYCACATAGQVLELIIWS